MAMPMMKYDTSHSVSTPREKLAHRLDSHCSNDRRVAAHQSWIWFMFHCRVAGRERRVGALRESTVSLAFVHLAIRCRQQRIQCYIRVRHDPDRANAE
jgi:hypothetical protein